MAPDPLQQAWKAQTARITVDASRLQQEVQRSQSELRFTVFFRDLREIGVALVMIPVWIIMGVTKSLPWTWYLGVPAFLWVAGFMLIDRKRHPQRLVRPGEPLVDSAKESLLQVEHQIRLLRNVFWWYLLPFLIAILAFFLQVAWQTGGWWSGLGATVFVVALYSGIYWLNQFAVRRHLEPQRQELLKLLASLKDESTSELSGEYPILMGANRVECSPRRMMIGSVCAVVILAIGVPGILYFASRLEEYFDSRKSPFAAVLWEASQPEVKVGDEWFRLVSLDGIPAADIVAFSRRIYGDLWQKRFEEDLVDVLTGMGHKPGETVRLVVIPEGSQETRTLEGVPMTTANRRAIREAAQARQSSEQGRSVHIDDAEDHSRN